MTSRPARRAAALAALVLGLGAAGALAPVGAAATGPLQPVIVTLKSQSSLGGITGTRQARLREVIRRRRVTADTSYASLRARLDAWQGAGEITGLRRLWIFNGIAVSATQAVIDALRSDPLVADVRPDARTIVPAAVSASPGLMRIGAPAVWDLGDRGQGVVVATLDSGVDIGHPDLAGTWRGGTNSWFDPFGQHPAGPMDRSGHGTQVMGVMTAGALSGTALGAAPAARWIAARVFNDAGQSSLSATHLAFQWVLDPDGDPLTADAPRVVNSSWSFSSGGCNLEFAPDIQTLRAAGILPVFAAGNFTTLSASPANNPGAFAVGSTTAGDTIAGDSSRGPSACGEPSGTYPELTAPGTAIATTDLGGFYATVTGTSVAAPHVAGALALLLGERPDLSVTQQETILEQTAADLGAAGPDNVFGYGRLDVAAAQASLSVTPPPPPALDTTGPVVSAVAAAPSPASSGSVALTAAAADAAGVTAGAEWFDGADPGMGGGTAMTAADGAFDSASEALGAGIPADALSPGTHTISVRARDAAGNWGAPVTTALVVDRTGPVVSAVGATPSPVASGDVTLSAQAADDATATSAAEWFEGADPGAGNGTPMAAADGAFGGISEDLRSVVPTDALAPGAHSLSVRARDAAGNWGQVVATTITVDRAGPVVSAVSATPSPVAAGDVALTAQAADDLTATSAAEWFEGADPGAGNGTPMAASDGAFGGVSEDLRGAVPSEGLAPGMHTIWVRARDAAGNWGAPASATLSVDRTAPAVASAAVTPNPTAGAATVTLSALAADPVNGTGPASAVTAAEWFEGADPGVGAAIAMTAQDGVFGGTSEAVTATIPTVGMAAGAHTLKVRARDAAGNWGAVATVALTVGPPPGFSDGFESGTLGAWSSSSGGASRIGALAAARYLGAYGMQATITGNTPSWVQDTTPANVASYSAAFWFKPNGTSTRGATTDVFTALTGGSSPAGVLSVQYRNLTGPVRLQLRLSVARSGGTSTTSWVTVPEAWHRVGVTWSSSASATASLTVDGSAAGSLTKLNTSARRIETVRLGPSAGLASGMSGRLWFDAFATS